MRILIVSSEFPPGPGGIGTHAYQLALNLHRSGSDVRVLASQHWAPPDEVRRYNETCPFSIRSFRLLPTSLLKLADRLHKVRSACSEFVPDVVFATGERCVWVVAAAMRTSRIPWIAIGHGMEFGLSGWRRELVVRAFNEASCVVCVSDFTRREMLRCGVTPKSCVTIPNGGDDSIFRLVPESERTAFRQSLGLAGKRILLTVGNVSERKGQEVVIRSMPAILRSCPDTRYLMAGLPSEADQLTRLARELGVLDAIRFLGRVEQNDVVRLMNCCDVFVMASRRTHAGDFEGYGIAAVEAALCGAPAVVTAQSGLAEAVIDGRTGLCVPENDPDAIARAVAGLLENEPRRSALAAAARERAQSEQTWRLRVAEYEGVVGSLLNGSAREAKGMVA